MQSPPGAAGRALPCRCCRSPIRSPPAATAMRFNPAALFTPGLQCLTRVAAEGTAARLRWESRMQGQCPGYTMFIMCSIMNYCGAVRCASGCCFCAATDPIITFLRKLSVFCWEKKLLTDLHHNDRAAALVQQRPHARQQHAPPRVHCREVIWVGRPQLHGAPALHLCKRNLMDQALNSIERYCCRVIRAAVVRHHIPPGIRSCQVTGAIGRTCTGRYTPATLNL